MKFNKFCRATRQQFKCCVSVTPCSLGELHSHRELGGENYCVASVSFEFGMTPACHLNQSLGSVMLQSNSYCNRAQKKHDVLTGPKWFTGWENLCYWLKFMDIMF